MDERHRALFATRLRLQFLTQSLYNALITPLLMRAGRHRYRSPIVRSSFRASCITSVRVYVLNHSRLDPPEEDILSSLALARDCL